jgi:MFS family permease
MTAGGAAELCAAVPAGALAGRFGLWRYATLTRVGRFAAYTTMAFWASWWPLLALSVVVGLLRAGGNGLNQSMTAAVTTPEERIPLLATTRSVRNIGYTVSGGLCALVLATGSPLLLRLALVANGLSFLGCALLLSSIRVAAAPAARTSLDFSVLRDGRYAALIGAAAVFATTFTVLTVALPLLVVRVGVPAFVVPVVVTLNTVLVVLLQNRFARRTTDVPSGLRALRRSAVFLVAMALLLAVVPARPAALAVAVIAVAGLVLTFAEMTESPAWWALSYELAPPGRSDEYLAAFDVNYAALAIAGPPLLVLVVERGAAGWLGYAAVVLAALAVTHIVLRKWSPAPLASTPL